MPRTLSLLELLTHYLDFQREIVTRRSKHELRQAEKRAHILQGYLIALDNLDAVIALIRAAADTEEARTGLMEQFSLSEIQAVGDPRAAAARASPALARKEVEDEYADLQERIGELRALLGDEAKIDALIKEELLELKQIYGRSDDRRTRDRRRRGGARARGPDRRRGHGDRDHALGLHQAAARHLVPRAAPRRHRRDGDGHEGRRLHRAPLRRLDARLHPVLHLASARSTA